LALDGLDALLKEVQDPTFDKLTEIRRQLGTRAASFFLFLFFPSILNFFCVCDLVTHLEGETEEIVQKAFDDLLARRKHLRAGATIAGNHM
jgi:hypothetical protein